MIAIDKENKDDIKKQSYKKYIATKEAIKKCHENGTQKIDTPKELCIDIISKISEYTNLENKKICVLFNWEFVHELINKFNVNEKNITFICDNDDKNEYVSGIYNVENIHKLIINKKEIKMKPSIKKQFDIIVMNPPYQPPVKKKDNSGGSSSRGLSIWPKFVQLAIDLVSANGFVAAVHPNKWRKPQDKMFSIMTNQNILYLEMHSKQDGIKTFGASTPYDWYVMQKKQYHGVTEIKDADSNKQTINLKDFDFLPSCNLKTVEKLLAKPSEEKCTILHSYFLIDIRKPWISRYKTNEFIYPCVHMTGKAGVSYWYSSKKVEFLGIPKIVFGDSDIISNAVIDFKGEYGTTSHAMAIPISSQEEGEQIKKAIESKAFNDLLQKSLRWSQFQIDWRMFRYFRKDFWKEFI